MPSCCGERGRVQRARAAECREHELARIVAALDGDDFQCLGHGVIDHVDDGGGRRAHVDAERLGEAPGDGCFAPRRGRCGRVAAQQRALVEIAEHEVAVGDGGLGAAAGVAGRPRIGAGALRARRAARPPGSTQAIEPPPAHTSARSITGTRIGWPVPCIQRLPLAPPPTSYSGVVSYWPLRIRLALAVVPPMSKESRLGRPVCRARQCRRHHARRRARLHRHRRHGDGLRRLEHAAARAHHVEPRAGPARGSALSSRSRYDARIGPDVGAHRGRAGALELPDLRQHLARTGRRARPGSAARSRAPRRRSCSGLRKLNSSDTATACTRSAFRLRRSGRRSRPRPAASRRRRRRRCAR